MEPVVLVVGVGRVVGVGGLGRSGLSMRVIPCGQPCFVGRGKWDGMGSGV